MSPNYGGMWMNPRYVHALCQSILILNIALTDGVFLMHVTKFAKMKLDHCEHSGYTVIYSKFNKSKHEARYVLNYSLGSLKGKVG